jgi:aspartyl protease family protein
MKIIQIIGISASVFLSGCSGCSKSGQKQRLSHQSQEPSESRREERPISGEKTVVKMEKVNGVLQIPVEVDGVKMFFIFDTGASTISISETEANFLWKQGKLTKDDIIGTANFSDANGDISEGTIIVLTTVKIGDRVLKNVEASVVHNLNAPLLFGQSALGKFGKISIDNNRGEITFE